MNYRRLADAEIKALKDRGCESECWEDVMVRDPFCAHRYRNVTFSGAVRLGTATGSCRYGMIDIHAGIYDATIHNCVIGDGVSIRGVKNFIANYSVGDSSVIMNVNSIGCNRGATFGVGNRISVLNETGGNEVVVTDKLSVHVAWLFANRQADKKMIEMLTALSMERRNEVKSDFGIIGREVIIANTGTIEDVNIGDCAKIEGASRLQRGTVVSNSLDPVIIEADVKAADFVVLSGTHIFGGAVVNHAFIGQGVRLGNLFSAHESLFFANSTMENGEGAAAFAGPYSTSMHKSSLLIAGMFSFFNAGSGSNQSNHIYKLGPMHHGAMERGCKMASDSYVLWPARIGAFSLIMGRHVAHPDTTLLPFSYVIEKSSKSWLMPGYNLKSVGTIRDVRKWPARERRRDDSLNDKINCNLLSPYTVGRMMKGLDILNRILEMEGINEYEYCGTTIRRHSANRGAQLYRMAIDKFMGNSLISRINKFSVSDIAAAKVAFVPTHAAGRGEWIDMGGLLLPESELKRISAEISRGEVGLDGLDREFSSLAADYYDMEWTWVESVFEKWYGKTASQLTEKDIEQITGRWLEAVITLDRMLLDDARKEYLLKLKYSDADFEEQFASDPFVKMVNEHISAKTGLAESIIAIFGQK